ncbi:hypothetical protein [Legionella cardiaca]|uniref:Dot/Icm T4SS effector n=1 Tax=Legionella cardiaca TaxID=1071983 RepID=A0ABY8AQJ1_9GAMM|nr:hypothetical protein [Legionella cardiaca]WED42915.1 hypothetical protein PXX05_13585 [Legionella cardiaca]
MTKYVISELLSMENPYEKLIEEGDSLRESKEAIDALSPKELADLVSKIMLGCPSEKFSELNKKVSRTLVGTKFSQTVGQACVLSRLLETLNGETPHQAFQRDFDVSLFHKFSYLVAAVIPDMDSISEKLAQTAPQEKLSAISRQMTLLRSMTCGKQTLEQKCTQFTQIAEERRAQTKETYVSLGNSRDSVFATDERQKDQVSSSCEKETRVESSLI